MFSKLETIQQLRWIHNWYIYAVEYDAVLKKKELLLQVTTWL